MKLATAPGEQLLASSEVTGELYESRLRTVHLGEERKAFIHQLLCFIGQRFAPKMYSPAFQGQSVPGPHMAQTSSWTNSGSSRRGVRDGHEARPCLLAPTGRHLLRACINDWNKDRGYPKARGGTQEVSHAHSWKFDVAFKAPSKTESLSLANG